MSKDQQPLEMPSQCTVTGKAFVKVYGKERALETIQRDIDTLQEAYQLLKDNDASVDLRLKIAIQSDFWTQVKQSIE